MTPPARPTAPLEVARLGLLLLVAICAGAQPARAAAPAAANPAPSPAPSGAPADGKRVIALHPLRDVVIQLPSQESRDFGSDFQSRLVTDLTQSQGFIVVDPTPAERPSTLRAMLRAAVAPDFHWSSSYVPAAEVTVETQAFSFTTGSRGERMFYGFDERMRTPFNDGLGTESEEFPLRPGSTEPSWFDHTFDAKGKAPLDSRTGLDAADGFNLNLIVLQLGFKQSQFSSRLHLRVHVNAPIAGRNDVRDIEVSGQGFYFDISGGYDGYSGSISVARSDAFLQAMTQAVSGALASVETSVQGLPLVGRIDAIGADHMIFVGTGLDAGVAPGTIYAVLDLPGAGVRITQSVHDGSVGELVVGKGSYTIADLKPGMLLKEVSGMGDLGPVPPVAAPPAGSPIVGSSIGTVGGRARVLAAASGGDITTTLPTGTTIIVDPTQSLPAIIDKIILPNIGLSQPDLSRITGEGTAGVQAALNDALDVLLYPYRLWRYYQYDQTYKTQSGDPSPATALASMSDPARPVVAVIDSGVDYNHPDLHKSLWLNAQATTDALGRVDRYGWDFISGDSRPFDDGYHGTEVASAVLRAAPEARIMALKVFNPSGITSSAALYGAFQYAVDHGARIIVCGWATRRGASLALELGVQYAQSKGIPVIAAAGDEGGDIAQFAALPASFAGTYDNVLAVTAVDATGALVQANGHSVSAGAAKVALGVVASQVPVATPRGGHDTESSTGIAAGLAAGALAHLAAREPGASGSELIADLLAQAATAPGLASAVQGGKVLR